MPVFAEPVNDDHVKMSLWQMKALNRHQKVALEVNILLFLFPHQ